MVNTYWLVDCCGVVRAVFSSGSLTATTGFSIMPVPSETEIGYSTGTVSFKVFIASLIVFC